MGFVISKFQKKKKTTGEQLESIEQQIKNIEKFHKETEQRFRRVIGKFLVASIVIYVVTLIGYYYYFSPDTFRENILKFVPVLVFPIIILFSRKLLSWYYMRKLSKNESTLKILEANKKKILDDVMDKETYKKAKEILEKYAPEQLTKESVKVAGNTPIKSIVPVTPAAPQIAAHQRLMLTPALRRPYSNGRSSEPAFQAVPNSPSVAQPKLSLPRPILQSNRGAFDKLIDMIIGDGPGNRYALICHVCSSHNGMALKHEFEYLAFRCAYCLQWNPARKQKPQAPNLMSDNESQDNSDVNNSDEEYDIRTETVISKNKSDSPKSAYDFGEKLEAAVGEISLHNSFEAEKEETNIMDIDGNLGEDEKVPVSTSDLDLVDLHHALDEFESPAATSSPVTESSSNKLNCEEQMKLDEK